MAAVPFIAFGGSSNCRGLNSSILEATGTDWERWFGIPFTLSGQGSPVHLPGPGFPIQGTMPGIKVWSAQQPYAVNQRRTIVTGGAGTTLVYSGAHVGAVADSWVFISKNSNQVGLSPPGPPGGQGNRRKIVSDTADTPSPGLHTIVVSEAWGPAVHNDGEIAFLTDSFSIGEIDSTGFRLKKTGAATWSPNQWKDRHVVIYGATSREIVSNDADELVLDFEVYVPTTWADATAYTAGQFVTRSGVVYRVRVNHTSQLGVNDPPNLTFWETQPGFNILAGPGSAETIAGIETHAGGSFRPLQIRLDTAPVDLTGFDSSQAIHNQCTAVLPSGDVTCNAFPELMSQFRRVFTGDIYSMCMGRDSATISPRQYPAARAFFHGWQKGLRFLDFHPSSPDSLYVAMANALKQCASLLAQANHTFGEFVFVLLLAENDAQFPVLIDQIGDHMRTFRSAVRALMAPFGVVNMKFIMVGPSSLQWLPLRDQVYPQLQALVDEDIYSGLTDTRAGFTYAVGESPPVHFDTASQIKLGQAIFATYQAMVTRIAAEAPPVAAPSVDEPSLVVTSAQEIIDIIDKAIAENAGVVAYTINGRTVQLQSLDQMLRARAYYVGEVNRKKGIRRTLARFN